MYRLVALNSWTIWVGAVLRALAMATVVVSLWELSSLVLWTHPEPETYLWLVPACVGLGIWFALRNVRLTLPSPASRRDASRAGIWWERLDAFTARLGTILMIVGGWNALRALSGLDWDAATAGDQYAELFRLSFWTGMILIGVICSDRGKVEQRCGDHPDRPTEAC